MPTALLDRVDDLLTRRGLLTGTGAAALLAAYAPAAPQAPTTSATVASRPRADRTEDRRRM